MPASQSDYQQTIDWYNQNAEEYSQKIVNSPEVVLMQRFMSKLQPEAKILDAGCAAGRDCRIFKDNGFNPLGIDISESLIKLARENHPDLEFIQRSFLELPLAEKSSDGIWAHASLLHFEKISDLKKSLREFNRVLKPQGMIHIFVKQQTGKAKTEKVSHDYSGSFKRFFRFFTKEELENYLREASFNILDLQQDYIASDNRKEIKWIAVLAQKI